MRKKPTPEQAEIYNRRRRLARAVRRILPEAIQTPKQMLETAQFAKAYLAFGKHMDD